MLIHTDVRPLEAEADLGKAAARAAFEILDVAEARHCERAWRKEA
jgi:hypothetical protein